MWKVIVSRLQGIHQACTLVWGQGDKSSCEPTNGPKGWLIPAPRWRAVPEGRFVKGALPGHCRRIRKLSEPCDSVSHVGGVVRVVYQTREMISRSVRMNRGQKGRELLVMSFLRLTIQDMHRHGFTQASQVSNNGRVQELHFHTTAPRQSSSRVTVAATFLRSDCCFVITQYLLQNKLPGCAFEAHNEV